MHALVSIHDVAPHTFDKVKAIIETLPAPCRENLIILVIPGLDWQPAQLDQLREWQQSGIQIAGHGWQHRCKHIKGLKHRLHSLFISRDVAEHLALSSKELEDLLQLNYQWFIEHDFLAPNYYVPPAWAMGPLSKSQLKASHFRFFESTHGIYDSEQQRFYRLPLVGFEADHGLRKFVLRLWNWINEWRASAKQPLRISIHPHDPEYLLADALNILLKKVTVNRSLNSLP